MRRFTLTLLALASVGFVFWQVGCGQSGPKLVPVSGQITMGGKPVANVAVFFIGPDKKTVGVGRTDSEGRFRLQNGAMPGDNQVYFGVGEVVEDPAMLAVKEAAGPVAPSPSASLLPAKYTDPTNPQLTFKVPTGGTTAANFDLQP